MASFWLIFLAASVISLVAGLKMKSETFDPNDPFSGPRAGAKPGLIFMGAFGILLVLAMVVVRFFR